MGHCCCYCLGAQSCLILCNPMDCSPPGSSVHGISQSRILEWVAISFSRGFSQPGDQTQVSYMTGGCFTTEQPPGKANVGHTYSKKVLFIWNSNLTGHPVFYLATPFEGDVGQVPGDSAMVTPQPPALLVLPSALLLTREQATSQLLQSWFPHPHELLYPTGAPGLCQSWKRKSEDDSGCHLGSPGTCPWLSHLQPVVWSAGGGGPVATSTEQASRWGEMPRRGAETPR